MFQPVQIMELEKKLLSEKAKLKPLSYYSKQKVEIEKLLIKMKKVDFSTTILRFATAFDYHLE